MIRTLVGARYELLELIGEGGMGSVYRALDRLTGSTIALKRVRVGTSSPMIAIDGDTQPRLMLAREFETLATLHHPYIISVQDYGFDEEGRPFLTMALLEKATGIREVARRAPLVQQLRYVIQMLQALAYLHRHNIIHRDIKPANILIDHETDEVRVVDFGLASFGGTSETVDGTPAYIAPEIFTGYETSYASDLYGVGLILYEIFTGRFPYRSDSFEMLIHDIMYLSPAMNDIPPEFVVVVGRLLEKDPTQRYQRADVVIRDVCAAAHIPLPEESPAIRESFLQAAAFVGRQKELGELRAALDTAVMGVGSGWLIGGESGVGKSRLIHELRTYAMVKGMHVLRAPAFEQEGLTLSFWRDLVRQFVLAFPLDDIEASILYDFVPDLEDLLGRHIAHAPRLPLFDMQQRALLTLVGVLLRQSRPTLLILEDLHWADDLSILEQLSPFLDTIPLLMVGTYRNDERSDVPLRVSGMNVISLGRLSEENIMELSVFMLGEAGRDPDLLALLRRETEGNVFFLIEVLRALAEDVGDLKHIGETALPQAIFTEGIGSIVRRRLDRLPQEHHPMLRVAALYGRQIDVSVLQCLDAEMDYDTWLLECANVALFEKESSHVWQFAHDKLREGIVQQVDAAEVETLHERLAEAIEQAYPDDMTYTPNLALHWRMAGHVNRERSYALKATTFLIDGGRLAAAVQMGERALAIVEPSDTAVLAALRIQLGMLHQQMSSLTQAAEYLLVGLRDAQAVRNEALQERALRLLGQTETTRGNWPLGAQLLERSYALAQRLRDPLLIADNMVLLAAVAGWRQDLERQKHLYEEAYAIYEAQQSIVGLSDCLEGLATIAIAQNNHAEAAQYLDDAIQAVRSAGRTPRLTALLVTSSLAAYLRGDMARSKALAIESMALSDRLSLLNTRIDSRICLARIYIAQARLTEALGMLRVALKKALDYGHQARLLSIIIEYARVRFYQGDKTTSAEFVCAVLAHDRLPADARRYIVEPLRDFIRSQITPDDWGAADQRGRKWIIKDMIAHIAAEMSLTR